MPVGALWRRGHKPMKAQGLEYIENLGDYVKHNHGRIFTETTAEKLIKEGNQVVGIEARKANGAKVKIHTRHGVVLATGGFGANTKCYNNIIRIGIIFLMTLRQRILLQLQAMVSV